MHASYVPPEILERVSSRRGPLKTFSIDPAKTAHVVIDLQVGFCAPGAISEVPVARDIVPNVNSIASALREAGGHNVFIRFTVDDGEPHYWASWYARLSDEVRADFSAAFKAGAEQHALWPELDVQPDDLIVDKTRLSAFIPGTCALHDLLQSLGVDTIILTGTLTNACCESTARDAMQMGYKVLFVQDGNATWDDTFHNATLANMAMIFADVCTAEDVVGRIAKAAPASQAA